MGEDSTESEQYEDVIIQESNLLEVVTDIEKIQMLNNPRYLTILKIIYEKGPLTLNELTDEYGKTVNGEQAKSDSSVYRYLTPLRENGFVQEAGQRIIEGKAHAKTLYSLTSSFIIIDENLTNWFDADGSRLFEVLVAILSALYPARHFDKTSLLKWHTQFKASVNEDKDKLLSSNNPNILSLLSIWTPYSFDDILAFMGWESFLLKEPTAQVAFLQSIKEKKVDSAQNFDRRLSPKNSKHRDVIRQFPEFFTGISLDDPRSTFFEKPAYIPLLHIIRDGPITIEELVKEYNQRVSTSKTQKTIYRYIQKLRKANLVIEMGQRVTQGRRTTQKLFGPISRNISYIREFDPDWQSDQRQWLLETIIELLEFLHPNSHGINKDCFQQFRATVSRRGDEDFINELKMEVSRYIFEFLHYSPFRDFYMLITTLYDCYYFFHIPELSEKLRKCISD